MYHYRFGLFFFAAALPTRLWLSHFVIFCRKSLAAVMWACASFNTKRLPAGQFVSATPQRSRTTARLRWHGASRLQNGIDSDGMWPVNCPPWSAAGKWISVLFCSWFTFRWILGAKWLLFMFLLLTSSVNSFNVKALDSFWPCSELKNIDSWFRSVPPPGVQGCLCHTHYGGAKLGSIRADKKCS